MADDLKQIQGIGKILEQRLVASGIDSYARLAAADAGTIAALPGFHRAGAQLAIAAAAQLAAGHAVTPDTGLNTTLDLLLPTCESLMAEVQGLAFGLRERERKPFSGRHQRKIAKEIEKLLGSLRRVRASMADNDEPLRQELLKADRKMTRLAAVEKPKKLKKGLRKTRKKLEKVIAG